MREDHQNAISLTQKVFSSYTLQKLHGNSFQIHSFRDMFSIISSISSAGGLNPMHIPMTNTFNFGYSHDITIQTASGQSFTLNKEDLYVDLGEEFARSRFANYPIPVNYNAIKKQMEIHRIKEISLEKAFDSFCNSRSQFEDPYNMMYNCAYWFSESIRHRCFFVRLLFSLSTITDNRPTRASDIIDGGIASDKGGYGMVALGSITKKHPIDLLAEYLKNFYPAEDSYQIKGDRLNKAYGDIYRKLQKLFYQYP